MSSSHEEEVHEVIDFQNENHFLGYHSLPLIPTLGPGFYSAPRYAALMPDKHWCFIGEITEIKNHARITLIVRDRDGEEVTIGFYTEFRGKGEEELELDDLKIGCTVLVLYPSQYQYQDGSCGIRLEEIRFFKVLPISMENLFLMSDLGPMFSEYGTAEGYCNGCEEIKKGLQKCAACSRAWYCDRDCLRAGWGDGEHDDECKLLNDKDVQMISKVDWNRFDGFLFFERKRLLLKLFVPVPTGTYAVDFTTEQVTTAVDFQAQKDMMALGISGFEAMGRASALDVQ